mmetsp:Transcript_81941/g.196466  ORF Transcript_81941/g.196466 Transcript_81941/m.196466 type:complete len:225 (+) Transcript_81941:550-1224(+)
MLQLCFLGPSHILVISKLCLQLRPLLVILSVEAIDEQLLLLNLVMPLADFLLILLDELFSVCQLVAELLVSIFQHLVVCFGVQAIHSHTCDLIEEVLCLDLFGSYLFSNLLHPLPAVGRDTLARGLLALFLFNLSNHGGNLAGHSLHVPVEHFHGSSLLGDSSFELLRLFEMLIHALVESGILVHELFALLLQTRHLRLQVLHLLVIPISKGTKLLVPFLLRPD